jgi:hypothetical protein
MGVPKGVGTVGVLAPPGFWTFDVDILGFGITFRACNKRPILDKLLRTLMNLTDSYKNTSIEKLVEQVVTTVH